MTLQRSNIFLAVVSSSLLAACGQNSTGGNPEFGPFYNGIERNLLDVDLVNMKVSMTGARDENDVAAYAECAIAQYALKRGYGFARHVRTNMAFEAGIWRADAVYTISQTLPQGTRTLDAEVTVQN